MLLNLAGAALVLFQSSSESSPASTFWLPSSGFSIIEPLVESAQGPPLYSVSIEELFRRGRWNLGFNLGFAFGVPLSVGYDSEIGEVRILRVSPSAGMQLSDPIGSPDRWYRGNFEIVGEGGFLFNFEPHRGYAAGFDLLLRYNFLGCGSVGQGKWVPFAEVGAGLVYMNMDLYRQSDRFNFSPQAGGGIQWFATENSAFHLAVRLHHVSNAGLGEYNRGLNNALILAGWTWYF